MKNIYVPSAVGFILWRAQNHEGMSSV